MNRSTAISPFDREAREARFALRVAARLTERSAALPHDINERLRIARQQALERARAKTVAAPQTAPAVLNAGRGSLLFGGDGSSGWWRLAALLPVVALVVGMVTVQIQSEDEQAADAAEIDAALLSDDLPPAAYADPGFAEFLRQPAD
ncbi:DUF3619 family protein [Caldimonas sp. KR1-144]|uniref:DUF3619 family protein n=1 Tax=Caldimonas sp. KR1-144 TaxID=3400911 RepID=UPI003BFDAF21